jgi:hypothetical protein
VAKLCDSLFVDLFLGLRDRALSSGFLPRRIGEAFLGVVVVVREKSFFFLGRRFLNKLPPNDELPWGSCTLLMGGLAGEAFLAFDL